ncbi:MAG TPA: BlaI/MecI/CopY family transcriptional regulator [Bacteriovoracaceae bacterium]|nr:BlaI/MecI/CopY family transcriptional regulator [Bacteriovoracaceae bacterium]
MKEKRKLKIDRPLTEAELQLMTAIWILGPCTVKGVQTELAKEKELAYTSVATFMKILETKGYLKSFKSDKAHTFESLISREEYEKLSLGHMAENLFDGDHSMMVMKLLNDSHLSKKDLEAIRKVLNSRLST